MASNFPAEHRSPALPRSYLRDGSAHPGTGNSMARTRRRDRTADPLITPTEVLRVAVDRVALRARQAIAAGREPEIPWLLALLQAQLSGDLFPLLNRVSSGHTAVENDAGPGHVLTADEGQAFGELLRELSLAPAQGKTWAYTRTELLSWAPRLGSLLHAPADSGEPPGRNTVPRPPAASATTSGGTNPGSRDQADKNAGALTPPAAPGRGHDGHRDSGAGRRPPSGPATLSHERALADALTRRRTGPAGRLAIAMALRGIRHRSTLTQRQVAQQARVSVATVNRYENWRDDGRIRAETVEALARVCGATEAESRRLSDLVRSQVQDWSAVPGAADHDIALLSFEASADEELLYACGVVPAPLQADGYASALRGGPGLPPGAERLPSLSGGRRGTAASAPAGGPLRISAVLDEGVLHRQVAGREVMERQYEHLTVLAHRPDTEIRVLPFTAGADAAGVCGSFTVVSWDDASSPAGLSGIVHRPQLSGASYTDDPGTVHAYRRAHARLRSKALDEVASLYLITEARLRFV
ncbi:helix-turn-helix transcriptional regulator [Streptomyces sp. NPDC051014]|uniref:helix-turn-helix domain-containing protein n=1 Tax=Streptomyces sp. NPDC051014 TaxID=3155751 RepID=UPI0033C2349C